MKPATPRNPERSFGVSVGIVLCVIAAILWWRGRVTRADAGHDLGAREIGRAHV